MWLLTNPRWTTQRDSRTPSPTQRYASAVKVFFPRWPTMIALLPIHTCGKRTQILAQEDVPLWNLRISRINGWKDAWIWYVQAASIYIAKKDFVPSVFAFLQSILRDGELKWGKKPSFFLQWRRHKGSAYINQYLVISFRPKKLNSVVIVTDNPGNWLW